MISNQKGFGLLEAIVASAVFGFILASVAVFHKREADTLSKERSANNMIYIAKMAQDYIHTKKINNQANPQLSNVNFGAADKKNIYKIGDKNIDWLKQNVCFNNSNSSGSSDYVPSGTLSFLPCSYEFQDYYVEYFGSKFVLTKENSNSGFAATNATASESEFIFEYKGSEKVHIVDIAMFLQDGLAKQSFMVKDSTGRYPLLEIGKVTVSGVGLDKKYSVDERYPLGFFISGGKSSGVTEDANFYINKLRGWRTGKVAIIVKLKPSNRSSLLKDGSVALNKDAGLCWDAATNGSVSCIKINIDNSDPDNPKSTLELDKMDSVSYSVAFNDGITKSRTLPVTEYGYFKNGRSARRIHSIKCPVGFVNKFVASISAVAALNLSSGSEEWSRPGEGSLGNTVEVHQLISGVKLSWEFSDVDKVWNVSRSVGINDSHVLSEANMSFIHTQWCEK